MRSVHPTYEVFTRPTHNAHGLRHHNDNSTASTTTDTFVVNAPSIILELRGFSSSFGLSLTTYFAEIAVFLFFVPSVFLVCFACTRQEYADRLADLERERNTIELEKEQVEK